MSILCEHRRLTTSNASLLNLIHLAYNLQTYQLSDAPDWLNAQKFDIVASISPDAPEDQCGKMIRTMLAERFKLAVHRDTKLVPGYALMVAKSGPKLRQATTQDDDGVSRPLFTGPRGNLAAERISMTQLAETLSRELAGPVSDRTRLPGDFQLHLEWTPENSRAPANPDRPTLFTAVQEQLGLKLESRGKVPLETIVIDHVEKEPTEN